MITTVWALEQDKFDEADLAWCKGLDVKVNVEPLYSMVYSYGQYVSQTVQGLRIRIVSTTEKQETMLKLKYGNRLIVIQRYTELTTNELQFFNF